MQDTREDFRTTAAKWLNGTIQDGNVQTFRFPVGSGGRVVVAEVVRQQIIARPETIMAIIAPVPQIAEEWKRHGMTAVTLDRATFEMYRSRTLMGNAPEKVDMIVVDEMFPVQERRVVELLERFPDATVLRMAAG